jgi:hypothetical protein
MRCNKCDDTGMVKVDEIPEPQPCVWCKRGQAIWWSQSVVTTRIHNLKSD